MVAAVDGKSVALATPATYEYDPASSQVFRVSVLSGITLQNLTLSYTLGQPQSTEFTNSKPNFTGARALSVEYTSGLTLKNLRIVNAASKGLYLANSIGAKIDGLTVRGSHNKAGGGNGYGVELHEAFDNRLENLSIFDMRHSVIFFRLARRDRQFCSRHEHQSRHQFSRQPGSPQHRHRRPGRTALSIRNTGAMSGGLYPAVEPTMPRPKFIASIASNFATPKHHAIMTPSLPVRQAQCWTRAMAMTFLIGGIGNDTLVGGARRDTLTGGGGADRFLFTEGDDLDIITDFRGRSDGDKIVLARKNKPLVWDALRIIQDKNDVRIRYGKNAVLVLKNRRVAQISPADFEFVALN